MERHILWACWLHAAVVVSVLMGNAAGPERWWPLAVNMFLPQGVWAALSVVLLPLTLWKTRRWSWLPLVTSLCVAGPLMGLSWGDRAAVDGRPIRVMTYNVELWNALAVAAVAREIRQHDPDILCLQDARNAIESELESLLKTWKVAVQGQYVIASKYAIVDAGATLPGSRRGPPYFTAIVDVAGTPVTVVNAHFITPRAALTSARAAITDGGHEDFWRRGIPAMHRNVSRRLEQAESLAQTVRAVEGPLIVAGDLNAPPQSLVSRRLLQTGLVDAFRSSGRGYGYTFGHEELFGFSFVRIDRILVSRHFAPVRTFVGAAGGSDHRPVIADLRLRAED